MITTVRTIVVTVVPTFASSNNAIPIRVATEEAKMFTILFPNKMADIESS